MEMNADREPDGSLHFDEFVFDASRAELRHAGGGVVPLRPKTRALLEFLLSQPGRLVERGAILDAVWPGVTVCDESITQAVGELRRVLGPDGARLIRTVPRRGYILEAAVTEGVPGGPVASTVPPPGPPGEDRAPTARGKSAWLVLPLLACLLAAWWIVAPGGTSTTGASSPAMVAASGAGNPGRTEPASLQASAHERAKILSRQGVRIARDGSACRPRWLEARTLFEQAIEADPLLASAHAGIAYTYSNAVAAETSLNPTGDLRSAEGHALRAVELAPDLWEARAALGEALRLQRRHGEALAAFEDAVSTGEAGMTMRANLALVLLGLGRAEEAEPMLLERLATSGPGSPRLGTWLHALGLVQMHLGRGDHGAENIRRSLDFFALAPHDVRRLHFAAALALGGQIEDARAVAADVRSREPDLGIAYVRSRAASDNPVYLSQREALYRGLALAGVPEGRATVRAPAIFSRSCVPAPFDLEANTASVAAPNPSRRPEAIRLYREGNWAFTGPACPDNWLTARPLYERAIAADPSFAPAHAQLAFTYANVVRNRLTADPVEDLRTAERLAERAAELAPDLPQAHAVRGAVRLIQRRQDEALDAYRRAVMLDGALHWARGNVGLLLISLGRAEEAEPYLRASITLDPHGSFRGDWQVWVGLVDLLLGRRDFGAQQFQASLSGVGTASTDVRQLHLAAALALAGQVEDARAVAGDVLSREPRFAVDVFRSAEASDDPAYLAQRENLYRGLSLAGLPGTSGVPFSPSRTNCDQRFARAR